MPDVFFLMTQTASDYMDNDVFHAMREEVEKAVAKTLGLEPDQVVCYELVARRTSPHANPIQVLCLASANEKRLKKIVPLRRSIKSALLRLKKNPQCAAYFKRFGTAESWPIMPAGSWDKVRLSH